MEVFDSEMSVHEFALKVMLKGKIGAQSSFQLEPKDNWNHAFPSNMLEATGIDMALSEIPDLEVIPGVQIGFIGDKFIVKPTIQEMENLQSDLLFAEIRMQH
ncbi:hypothetical protein KY284_020201 [Solanum tuberosum]|nr:hypothetical protein KY284_020201 [Solanum tuberosum]